MILVHPGNSFLHTRAFGPSKGPPDAWNTPPPDIWTSNRLSNKLRHLLQSRIHLLVRYNLNVFQWNSICKCLGPLPECHSWSWTPAGDGRSPGRGYNVTTTLLRTIKLYVSIQFNSHQCMAMAYAWSWKAGGESTHVKPKHPKRFGIKSCCLTCLTADAFPSWAFWPSGICWGSQVTCTWPVFDVPLYCLLLVPPLPENHWIGLHLNMSLRPLSALGRIQKISENSKKEGWSDCTTMITITMITIDNYDNYGA